MPILLTYAFRPFFLFSCLYACLAMIGWLALIGLHAAGGQVLEMSISMPPYQWHAHEMLFGYTLAVITGFFLTAVPNWTDTRPVQGVALGALVAAWIAGRLAIWFSAYLPALLVAGLDLLLIPMLMALVVKALMARWSKRNLIFLPILLSLFGGNLLAHLEQLGWTEDTMALGHTLALNVIVVLIVIIGGRVVPAFTTNALRKQGVENLPQSRKPLELASIISVVAIALGDLAGLDDQIRGGFAIFAAVANTLRFAGWCGTKILSQPIVWIMHLGYTWLIIGLTLKAIALFSPLLVEATALHALTIGAVGSMTIGVMTRASLGHTGRVIVASPMMVLAYAMISLAALTRVLGPMLVPEFYNEAMLAAGLLWIGAFVILSFIFWPILTKPRINSTN